MKKPRPSLVADGLVAAGKMGRLQTLPERNRAGVAQAFSIFIGTQKIESVFLQHLLELRRVTLLEHQQGRVVRQSFGDPLIPITSPKHQVTPPLVRRLVDKDLIVQSAGQRIEAQIGLLAGTEKSKARQKDEAGPSLAEIAGHLGEGERGIRIRTKPAREVGNRLCGPVRHGLRVMSRRWRRRSNYYGPRRS